MALVHVARLEIGVLLGCAVKTFRMARTDAARECAQLL